MPLLPCNQMPNKGHNLNNVTGDESIPCTPDPLNNLNPHHQISVPGKFPFFVSTYMSTPTQLYTYWNLLIVHLVGLLLQYSTRTDYILHGGRPIFKPHEAFHFLWILPPDIVQVGDATTRVIQYHHYKHWGRFCLRMFVCTEIGMAVNKAQHKQQTTVSVLD